VFLSTSRVYPVAALNRIALVERATRFEPAPDQPLGGVSIEGVSEGFPLDGARTPYGATKLAAELLIAEYADAFGVSAVIDRCGVIAGPWQMGKVDQGVFAYWLLAHYFGLPLEYIGFGGTGKQVRDVLHVDDLVDLIDEQLMQPDQWRGVTANVGGGRSSSLSLRETTELCRELTGRTVEIRVAAKDRPGDVPYYVSDCRELFQRTTWRPRRDPRSLLADILSWLEQHEGLVGAALGASRPARR
jgi:CDP-paratose 2-epimerase